MKKKGGDGGDKWREAIISNISTKAGQLFKVGETNQGTAIIGGNMVNTLYLRII